MAVGGKVAWHVVGGDTRFVNERDGHPAIAKGVGPVRSLVGLGAVQGQRHGMPLAQLAGDDDGLAGRSLAGQEDTEQQAHEREGCVHTHSAPNEGPSLPPAERSAMRALSR